MMGVPSGWWVQPWPCPATAALASGAPACGGAGDRVASAAETRLQEACHSLGARLGVQLFLILRGDLLRPVQNSWPLTYSDAKKPELVPASQFC